MGCINLKLFLKLDINVCSSSLTYDNLTVFNFIQHSDTEFLNIPNTEYTEYTEYFLSNIELTPLSVFFKIWSQVLMNSPQILNCYTVNGKA